VKRLPAYVLLAALVAGATGGCAVDVATSPPPACDAPPDEPNRLVVLMAQAVPSAKWLPCVRGLPVGWDMGAVEIEDGRGRFWLDSDRDGVQAVRVEVTARCDVSGTTEVPSERPGTRRFERVTRVEGGYGGSRHYTYLGGCTTYVFDLRGETLAQPLSAIGAALDFVNRAGLREQVRRATDGRLELDPEDGT
jgi:hypothetical protein